MTDKELKKIIEAKEHIGIMKNEWLANNILPKNNKYFVKAFNKMVKYIDSLVYLTKK